MGDLVLNPLLNSELKYNAETDVAPIAYIGEIPSVLIGRTTLAASNVQELRANSGASMTMALVAGSIQHAAAEMLRFSPAFP